MLLVGCWTLILRVWALLGGTYGRGGQYQGTLGDGGRRGHRNTVCEDGVQSLGGGAAVQPRGAGFLGIAWPSNLVLVVSLEERVEDFGAAIIPGR